MHIPQLGIVSEKRQDLKEQSDYNRLLEEYEQTVLEQGKVYLDKLLELTQGYNRIAITCFEVKECMCHRGRVAKKLALLPSGHSL